MVTGWTIATTASMTFLKLGDKKDKTGAACFTDYSLGVVTNRDAWCINPSLQALKSNVAATIRFYNEERTRWENARKSGTAPAKIADSLNPDPKRISWTRQLRKDAEKLKPLDVKEGQFVPCMYRPFTKQWQFYSRRLNEVVYQMPRIFPNRELPNRVIAVTGKGGNSGFSALMLDALPSLDTIEKGQCFPFWLYEKMQAGETNSLLPGIETSSSRRREAISEAGLDHFRKAVSRRGHQPQGHLPLCLRPPALRGLPGSLPGESSQGSSACSLREGRCGLSGLPRRWPAAGRSPCWL